MRLQPFLTAYDPSDLPGGSVDPLGFERGYLFLAEKVLPGLTNVASRPRYFSSLCAAVALSDQHTKGVDGESPRARYERRLACVQRFERFWALGCALASRKESELETAGIRGIRYVEAALQRLDERGETSTNGDFRLLSRQVTYGAVGMYGSVAEELRLLARDTLALSPHLGWRLAEAFVEETELPGTLRAAVTAHDGAVATSTLQKWALRAHLDAAPGPREAAILAESLALNDTRQRMTLLLQEHPLAEEETELQRLRRMCQALAPNDRDPDLREALRAILAFEDIYRVVLLAFQRLLWFCQAEEPFAFDLERATGDTIIADVHARLPDAARALDAALAEGRTPAFSEGLQRLEDTLAFALAAAAAPSPVALVELVLGRHTEVQRAKLDQGRPKMPWIEIRGDKVAPTLSVAQRIGVEPESVEQMAAHPYRTAAADRLFRAARGA